MGDLPLLIEERFKGLAPYKNDVELFERLKGNLSLLMRFFEQASQDETWSAKHLEFCHLVFGLFTQSYLDAQLEKRLAERLSKVIQEHYFLYAPILPKPIAIRLADREISVNPISVSIASSYLEQRINTECVEKQNRSIELLKLDPELATWIFLYMETGQFGDLFRWDCNALNELLEMAEKFQLKELSLECEKLLTHYVTDENCDEILRVAIKSRRAILLEAALACINRKARGFALYSSSLGGLKVELSHFDERVFAEFKHYAPYIQEVKASESVLDEDAFWSVLQLASQLQRLDISGSIKFNSHLLTIPHSITDLDISACGWMTEENFQIVCASLYWLKVLNIAHNLDLSYRSLSALRHLKELEFLDVSHCNFKEEEWNLMGQILPNLQNLTR